MRHYRLRRAATALAASALLAAPLLVSAVTKVSVPAEQNANVNQPKQYKLDAAINETVTGPVGEAAAAAKVTATSPELQGAVKSVWSLAWDAFWEFFVRIGKGFLGLFTSSVSVNLNGAEADANVNAQANVNAAAETQQP
jgi:hypothetical protein